VVLRVTIGALVAKATGVPFFLGGPMVTKAKAKKILRHGRVKGKKLTSQEDFEAWQSKGQEADQETKGILRCSCWWCPRKAEEEKA